MCSVGSVGSVGSAIYCLDDGGYLRMTSRVQRAQRVWRHLLPDDGGCRMTSRVQRAQRLFIFIQKTGSAAGFFFLYYHRQHL